MITVEISILIASQFSLLPVKYVSHAESVLRHLRYYIQSASSLPSRCVNMAYVLDSSVREMLICLHTFVDILFPIGIIWRNQIAYLITVFKVVGIRGLFGRFFQYCIP